MSGAGAPRIEAVFLAAGGATRYPGKLAARIADETVIGASLAAALVPGIARVAVVVGSEADDVWALALAAAGETEGAGELGAAGAGEPAPRAGDRLLRVDAERWRDGLAASLAAGVRALSPEAEWVGFFLADQPALSPRTTEALVAEARALAGSAGERSSSDPPSILYPVHAGEQGHPVFFRLAEHRAELLALAGDAGAKSILRARADRCRAVAVDDPGAVLDVDRPGDLARVAGARRGGAR